jgi:hypothetical protein
MFLSIRDYNLFFEAIAILLGHYKIILIKRRKEKTFFKKNTKLKIYTSMTCEKICMLFSRISKTASNISVAVRERGTRCDNPS